MMRGSRTLWIVGTSVSIEHGGYVDQLSPLAIKQEFSIRNISVGDQTSVMGCMRVFAHRSGFRAGDAVVWEYSLLDHLLSKGHFSEDDITYARRMAWNELNGLGVAIIALMCAPREAIAQRTTAEILLALDAAQLDIPCIDVRELFNELKIESPSDHYRDDRHLHVESPVVALVAERVVKAACSLRVGQRLLTQTTSIRPWEWVDLSVAASRSRSSQEFSNSLMTVRASALAVDDYVQLPTTRRVVALGIVSTHEAGAVWCGHPECPPASARLPSELSYAFLLRATGIPCTRASIDRLVSAPDWMFRNGSWRAYGQAAATMPGPVAVFGALVESAEANDVTKAQDCPKSARPRFASWWFTRKSL